jgi:hypothetical protein
MQINLQTFMFLLSVISVQNINGYVDNGHRPTPDSAKEHKSTLAEVLVYIIGGLVIVVIAIAVGCCICCFCAAKRRRRQRLQVCILQYAYIQARS